MLGSSRLLAPAQRLHVGWTSLARLVGAGLLEGVDRGVYRIRGPVALAVWLPRNCPRPGVPFDLPGPMLLEEVLETTDIRFDRPLYPTLEAARLVGVRATTLRNWLTGYERVSGGRPVRAEPVVDLPVPDLAAGLSFIT